jgi:hypothetical protein
VEFRATSPSGALARSPRYYWPVGVAFPSPGAFTAVFIDPRGSSSWVEVDVAANQPVAGVEVSIAGGAWTSLALTPWRSWAAPLSVPAGSVVEFRARNSAGASMSSQSYPW